MLAVQAPKPAAPESAAADSIPEPTPALSNATPPPEPVPAVSNTTPIAYETDAILVTDLSARTSV